MAEKYYLYKPQSASIYMLRAYKDLNGYKSIILYLFITLLTVDVWKNGRSEIGLQSLLKVYEFFPFPHKTQLCLYTYDIHIMSRSTFL